MAGGDTGRSRRWAAVAFAAMLLSGCGQGSALDTLLNPSTPPWELPTPTPTATTTVVVTTTPTPTATPATTAAPTRSRTPSSTAATPTPTTGASAADCKGAKDTRTNKDRPFVVCGVLVVSKKHMITAAYVPKLVDPPGVPRNDKMTPETAAALTQMFLDARAAGFSLTTDYGYRSYAVQAQFPPSPRAAPAGASEHQTGLAVDVAANGPAGLLSGYAFGDSKAGAWVRANAWRYGFIVRYPPGKEAITGIVYEPWHLRFVGPQVSADFRGKPSLTLEEYLDIR